jgi:hypothetical protein
MIIGIFILSWAISTIIYKVKKFDDIEVMMAPSQPGTELPGASRQ